MVAGYLHGLPAPRGGLAVLDVGCGTGRLAKLLASRPALRYLGIDWAPTALRRARGRRVPGARFRLADFETWVPGERYAAVVFCESANYARRPVATLRRFAGALTPRGVLVVSLYRDRRGRWRGFWRRAARVFDVVEATVVRNRAGSTWDVRLLRPRGRPAS